MPVESVTYIDDFVTTNPVGSSDPVSDLDAHIQNLKTGIQNTFPNLNAAVNATPTELNLLVGLTGVTGTGNLVASAAPTFTGQLTCNTLQINGNAGECQGASPRFRLDETDGAADEKVWDWIATNNEMYFRALNDTQTLATTFMQVQRTGYATVDRVTFTAGEFQLDVTTLDVNGAADFSSTVDIAGDVRIASAAPNLWIQETGVTADNGLWRFRANGEGVVFQAVNDAESVATSALFISRTGTTIDEIELNATDIDINGNVDISGALTLGSPLPVAQGGTGAATKVAAQEALGIYAGYVDSAVAAEDLPGGWSVTNPATGQYVVTHSLALSDVDKFNIVTTALGAAYRSAVTVRTANSFTVAITNSGGTLLDADFNFHCIDRN